MHKKSTNVTQSRRNIVDNLTKRYIESTMVDKEVLPQYKPSLHRGFDPSQNVRELHNKRNKKQGTKNRK